MCRALWSEIERAHRTDLDAAHARGWYAGRNLESLFGVGAAFSVFRTVWQGMQFYFVTIDET
jgi:hypothetical protein